MLSVTADDIRRLQGHGGERFTQFVDSLVRAQAFVAGFPDRDIEGNMRANIGDEGVDTVVHGEITPDPTGRFTCESVGQYKATAYRDVRVTQLLEGG